LHASQTRVKQNKVLLVLRKTLPNTVRDIPLRYGMDDLSLLSGEGSTLGELEILQRNNPSDTTVAKRLVFQYLLTDQAQEALPIVDSWSGSPEDSQILRLLSVAVWQQAGRLDFATGALDNWPAKDDVGIALVENARGLVLQADESSIKARDSFKFALRKNPSLKAARINLIDFEIARQNWNAAMLHLRRALALHPENVFFLDAFLQTAVMLDDIPARLRWLEDSGTTRKTPEPLILLADYYLRMDEPGEASLFLQKARQFMTAEAISWYADVDVRLSTTLALQAVAQGDKATARKIAVTLEKAYPGQIEARLSAVKIAFAMQEANEGHKINMTIKKAFPAAPEPYEIEGDFHREAGRFSLAAAAYQEAWTLQPKLALACKIRDMRMAGDTAETALEPLEEWLRLHPDDTAAMNDLAMGYLNREQDPEAEAWYRKFLALQPDNAVAYNNLAWIYLRQGNKDAFRIAEKAYQLDPDNEAIADTYAYFLYEKGARNPALGIIQEALRKHPTSTSLRKRLAQIRQTPF
jgi:tetratricopeptide (TPR) repeat protein